MEAKIKQMVQNGVIVMPFGLVSEFISYAIKVKGIKVKVGDVVNHSALVVCFDGYIGR